MSSSSGLGNPSKMKDGEAPFKLLMNQR